MNPVLDLEVAFSHLVEANGVLSLSNENVSHADAVHAFTESLAKAPAASPLRLSNVVSVVRTPTSMGPSAILNMECTVSGQVRVLSQQRRVLLTSGLQT
jgi:hypothetical protein